MATINK